MEEQCNATDVVLLDIIHSNEKMEVFLTSLRSQRRRRLKAKMEWKTQWCWTVEKDRAKQANRLNILLLSSWIGMYVMVLGF